MWPLSVQRWNANPNPNPDPTPNPNLHPVFTDKSHFTHNGLTYVLVASICDDADCKLFTRITGNTQHLLYPLLQPEREHHYTQSLRQRSHNCQLPDRTSVLRDKNFISLLECCIVMLFTGNYIFSSYSLCNGVLSAILLKLKWNEMRRYDLRPTRSCVSTFHTRVYAANCWSQSDKTHTTTTRSHS